MIWKILFVLMTLLVAFVSVTSQGAFSVLTDYIVIAGVVLMAVVVFTLGYFYSLGWKKRLYSNKASNIILGIICVYILFSIFQSVQAGLPVLILGMKNTLVGNVSDNSVYWTALILVLLTSVVLYSLIWLPSIIAYFKYKKHNENFAPVERPYWKLFVTATFLMFVSGQILFFFMADKSSYNLYDYIATATVLLDALFLFGFAYNIKFFNQLVWKIIAVPYVLLNAGTYFWCSESYRHDTGLSLFQPPVTLSIATIIGMLIYFYVLYRYAFTEDVFKSDVIEEKTY